MELLELSLYHILIYESNRRYYIDNIDINILYYKEFFKKIKELYTQDKLEHIELLKFNKELISKISDIQFVPENIEYIISELKENYNRNLLKNKLTKAINDLSNFENTTNILSDINKDTSSFYTKETFKTSEIITSEMYRYLEEKAKNEIIETGILELDNLLNGIQKTNLVIISARASAGKTTFAIQTAINLAKKKFKVFFISLEMNAEELAIKIYSRLAEVDGRDILSNKPNTILKIAEVTNEFLEYDFKIDDKSCYIEDIISNIKMLSSKNQVDVVFIDYIGLIKSKEKSFSRENEVAKISRDLKLCSRDCNIPIFVLAQLNRLAENQEPTLAMLRESGSLEQDANKVIFLYQEQEHQDKAVSELHIKVAKNREGLKGKVLIGFDKRIGKIAPFVKKVR